ncbi:MAG: hypothetical protein HQ582_20010 [Planctomycetes bacterium]|nr:hypothetical protein [Planctomycetota bacterium]
MAKSRYPRRGHRIAPSTLREILEAPVPIECLPDGSGEGLLLCDLDESSWERFGEEGCLKLATEVLHAVGRAARMPMPIADRRLPVLPRGMKLTDLGLEVRTINCLIAAGIHERPQDLRNSTIEGILGLRGFWVKCLVDLLTSVEYVVDHPGSRRELRSRATAPIKAPRISSRYPRPGHRLAPQTLREILTDPIPAEFNAKAGDRTWRFCDLDESAWRHFGPEEVGQLADLIVSRVNVSGCSRVVRQRRLPKPPKGMRLEDLGLENRTFNCLDRTGFGKRPEDLGKRTVGDLLAIKAFGAKCLVDLISALETLVAREGKLDGKLTAEAEALAEIPEIRQIHFSDPRLGGLLRVIDTEANTISEMVKHVVNRRLDPPDPLRLCEQVREVRRKATELCGRTLEEELTEIFAPAASGRDREIVASYYGWDGGGGHTLEELGKRYGLSRERIRQVCVRAIKRIRGTTVFAPVLDRALAFIAERLPKGAEELRRECDSAGFSACGLPLETVREAAELLSREPKFELVAVGRRQVAVKPEWASLPRTIIQVARRAVVSYGTTTISEVAAEVFAESAGRLEQALVEETLQALDDFEWLYRKRGWFQLESLPQYGLPKMIEKILSVAGRIEASKLRSAIARYRRTGRNVPPAGVLLEFCRRMPGVEVEGNAIRSDPPRDWREVLVGVEAGMVRVLKKHGPVMERGVFEEQCIRDGMNRFSFNAIIMSSPVITQMGRSVYGLVDAKVDRRLVQSLARRKPGTGASRVLRGSGRTDDDRIYMAYRLSKAAISGGVITVPATMKDVVQGRFTIHTHDGEEAGTLVSKSGCAWGLGPILRSRGAEPGDHLLILFDEIDRVAQIHIGAEDVLEPVAGQLQTVG